MNRLDWQQLAERWLLDAKAMLNAQRRAAAYYVAGYAVECGLKACILARMSVSAEVIFEDRKFSERCWTHQIPELVKLANLETIRLADIAANPIFFQNWLVVKDWSEAARYQTIMSYRKAKKFYQAIVDSSNGVMPWIQIHW